MASHNPGRNLLAMAVLAALGAGAVSVANAQTRNASVAGTEKEATTLDTMIVTAQKREEVLQDVPISINVIQAERLQDNGIRDVKDLQILVPGLSVTSSSSNTKTTVRLRGVGTLGDNPGLESAVGIVIDGVPRARTSVGFGDLGDVERIEVLKGPQGTLFGKNTSAGVINILTRRPSFTQRAEGEVTVGNYGAVGISGFYNDALGENAAFNIYATKRKRDGFTDVITAAGPRTSEEDGTENFHSIRSQLLFQPTENLDINIIGDFTSREEECCVGVTVRHGPTLPIINALTPGGVGLIPVPDPERRLSYQNRDTDYDIKDKGISAEVNWVTPWLGGATLTSITSNRSWDSQFGTDLDYSAADLAHYPSGPDNGVSFDTFTQELRLTGSTDRLDWMGGLYYSDEDVARRELFAADSGYEPYLSILLVNGAAGALPAGMVNTANGALFVSQATGLPFGTAFAGQLEKDVYKQNAKSTAAFTNLTFHATDALDLTLGLRYTNEKKEAAFSFQNPNGSPGCAAALNNLQGVANALIARGVPAPFALPVASSLRGTMCLPWANPLFSGVTTHQEREEKEWSGTFKAAYRWNEDVMTYASASRGYKAGGFNMDRKQLNFVPQVDTSFPGEFVDAYEIGAKTTWMDGNLLLNGALFYQDFSNFQLNTFDGKTYVVRSIPELVSQGAEVDLLWQTGIKGLNVQAGIAYTDAKFGDDLLPLDPQLALLPGNRLVYAPKWETSLSADYEWNMFDTLVGRFSIGAKHSTEYNTSTSYSPYTVQPAYTLLNARLGIGPDNKRWNVELWAQNLTDETYLQGGFDAPLQAGTTAGFLGAPRTYGVTFRVRY